ncbi:hypothetical protein TWF173_003677 [Orbilia oligospora]|nr:hypothetical protein TWF173_003677 [Orbilia oligospora]
MSFAKQIFLGGNMIFRGMREWILNIRLFFQAFSSFVPKESMSRQNQFFGWAGKWRLKGKDQRKFEVKPLTATVDLGLILLDRRDRSGLYPWAGITSPVCE